MCLRNISLPAATASDCVVVLCSFPGQHFAAVPLTCAVSAVQYSRNSSLGAICGRGDVNAAHPVAYGCYDTKVANFAMAAQRWAAGVVGPTTGQVGCCGLPAQLPLSDSSLQIRL